MGKFKFELFGYKFAFSKEGGTIGVHIVNKVKKTVDCFGIQITTKDPFWYPQCRPIKFNREVKGKNYICGWLFIYFFVMLSEKC